MQIKPKANNAILLIIFKKTISTKLCEECKMTNILLMGVLIGKTIFKTVYTLK